MTSIELGDQHGAGIEAEQARVIAETKAAVVVAQSCPRSPAAARAAMQTVCRVPSMADQAFYSYPRGVDDEGKPNMVRDISVVLARELARCWGNIQYGTAHIRQNMDDKFTEAQAWAWDVETNTRASTNFIVRHEREVAGRTIPLTSNRDIYEHVANMSARRLREQIKAMIPDYFIDEARDECQRTIEKGDGTPLPDRVAACVASYDAVGINVDRIEQKLGRPKEQWTVFDVAQLAATYRYLQRGEANPDVEFPRMRVTAAEITRSGSTS